MAIVTTDNRYYSEIAAAIREKAGGSAKYLPSQMAAAIKGIQAGEAMSIETIWKICGYDPDALPSGYTKLSYIEANGTQWINTGFKPNQNTRVVFSGYNCSASSGWIYGAWQNQTQNQFCCSALGTYSFRYGQVGVSLSTLGVGAVEIDQNKNTYNMNGVSGSFTTQIFSSAYTMYLFRINAAGTASSGNFAGRVYFCQIYDNGTLVRDFVPCINPSGAYGLYDRINDKFYGNAGSGAFTGG